MTTPKRRQNVLRAQHSLIKREQEAGIVRVTVRIHKKRRTQLQEIVGQWMFEDILPEPPVPPNVAKT